MKLNKKYWQWVDNYVEMFNRYPPLNSISFEQAEAQLECICTLRIPVR